MGDLTCRLGACLVHILSIVAHLAGTACKARGRLPRCANTASLLKAVMGLLLAPAPFHATTGCREWPRRRASTTKGAHLRAQARAGGLGGSCTSAGRTDALQAGTHARLNATAAGPAALKLQQKQAQHGPEDCPRGSKGTFPHSQAHSLAAALRAAKKLGPERVEYSPVQPARDDMDCNTGG